MLFRQIGDLLAACAVLLGPDRQDGVEGFVFAAAVLADVEIGLELAADLFQQPFLARQHCHQFTAAHVAAVEDRFIAVVGVLRCHQIHGHIGVLALDQAVVDLLGKRIVVAIVFKANLVAAQHVVKYNSVQSFDHV